MNWKTTLFGVLAAIGQTLSHTTIGTVAEIGNILSIVATGLLGWVAKDSTSGTAIK